ncbi:MAG: hypothetical protein O7A04_06740 [Acidobacteria bacterium]|nr:hypothetical protein [Acidobacteriota bacterium]
MADKKPQKDESVDRRVRWNKRAWQCRVDVAVGLDTSKEIYEIHHNRPEAEALVRKHTKTDWVALKAELTTTANKALKKNFDDATRKMSPEQKATLLKELAAEPAGVEGNQGRR